MSLSTRDRRIERIRGTTSTPIRGPWSPALRRKPNTTAMPDVSYTAPALPTQAECRLARRRRGQRDETIDALPSPDAQPRRSQRRAVNGHSMFRSAARPLTASHPRRMAMLPTTATTSAATVGHHCSRAKNIVTRSRSRRPSRQSFLADAPIASARLPNTMKQARAPATLGNVTSIYLTKGQARHQDFAQDLEPFGTCRRESVPERAGTMSTAMLATPWEVAAQRRDGSWSGRRPSRDRIVPPSDPHLMPGRWRKRHRRSGGLERARAARMTPRR